MNTPKFTAEISLYQTSGIYRSSVHMLHLSGPTISRLQAAAIMVGEEVIEVHGEAPLGLPWGWGPWGWGSAPSTPAPADAGAGSGGPSPGGAGDPAAETGGCPPPLQLNPDYDRAICRECLGECDRLYPLEPCEDSKLWCEAINAEAQRERQRCAQETCGWRCTPCT